MMKRILLSLLCLMLLPVLMGAASAEEAGWYQVDSSDPEGYCYLYSAASDRDEISTNLGRYDNGEVVYVMNPRGGQDGWFNYCLVQTMDGQTGYIHDYALTRYYGDPFATAPGWYMVTSLDPYGYCYLYSAASDRNELSYNKGPCYNGELVYVMDYYGGKDGRFNYCYVRTQEGETGYVHDYALTRYYGAQTENHQPGWYIVQSTYPNGYCYLYSAASDRRALSYNKGPYENGEWVYVLDYYGGRDGSYNYCRVRTMDGKEGYMHDYALVAYPAWQQGYSAD